LQKFLPWFHVKIKFKKHIFKSEPLPSVAHPKNYCSAWFHHKMSFKSFREWTELAVCLHYRYRT